MQRHVFALAALVIAGCASTGASTGTSTHPSMGTSTPATSSESVVGRHWIGHAPGVDPKMQPRLEFMREGRITGYTGCNMLSGTWRTDGNEVHLGNVIATKRMCVGPEGDAESHVLPVLSPNTRVTVEGSKLVLEGTNGQRFEFGEDRSAR